MKRDLIKILLKEKIIEKAVGHEKEVHIFAKDLVNQNGYQLIDIDDLPDLIHDLELETRGKIKLIHPLPIETEESLSLRKTPDGFMFHPPQYYCRVSYDPNSKDSKKEIKVQEHSLPTFMLSPNDGLYRYRPNGDKEEYKILTKEKGYAILTCLEKNYKTTKEIAAESGYDISAEELQQVRGQISRLRKMIASKFKGVGEDGFIQGEKGRGYRLHPSVKLKLVK